MYKQFKPMFLYCETAMHAGAGTGVGRVDLPIQREGHTGFPKIESSSLKGSLREHFEEIPGVPNQTVNDLFGPEDTSNIGLLGLTDARLLLFPIRSAKGIFAFITCPHILNKLKSDYLMMGEQFEITGNIIPNENEVIYNGTSLSVNYGGRDSIMLEEFVFDVINLDTTINNIKYNEWLAAVCPDAYKDEVLDKVVIVRDTIFQKLVSIYTEVITRNHIDNDTGVVKDGQLFTEEYLPCNSVMYYMAMFGNGASDTTSFDSFLTNMNENKLFRIGGGATIGKGFVTVKF